MLTLMVLSAASVNAQVRIGGTDSPHDSAVLDLNPNTGNATGGLALPRVELIDSTQWLNGTGPQPGTVVYNQKSSAKLAEGAYIWTPITGGGTSDGFTHHVGETIDSLVTRRTESYTKIIMDVFGVCDGCDSDPYVELLPGTWFEVKAADVTPRMFCSSPDFVPVVGKWGSLIVYNPFDYPVKFYHAYCAHWDN
ncbi:hypothetical protein FACS189437_02840 [Bacteroidia bacterium]|nr:hypothetical protein FACS189437_02840 [Bacteroidia bacterium]